MRDPAEGDRRRGTRYFEEYVAGTEKILAENDQRAGYKRFGPGLYDMTTVRLSLKVRLLKAEIIETPL